jgi:transposase
MANSTASCRRKRARVERGGAALRGALVVDWEQRLAEMKDRFAAQERRFAEQERRFAEQEQRHAEEVARLQKRIDELTRTVAEKDRRIAELDEQLARARKTSRNSSKPPSSDIVKPVASNGAETGTTRRKRGGQLGHPRCERPDFAPDEIDRLIDYRPDTCPCCGEPLVDQDSSPNVECLTQIELPLKPLCVTRHCRHTRWCATCHREVTPPWPPGLLESGLVGPRLTALVGFLKGPCGMTMSALRRFFRDVCQVRLSKGFLAKLLNRVSGALGDPYEELLRLLPDEKRLNVDETGHKDGGQRYWTWVFRATLFALYKISPSRGSDVLLEVLGNEFGGLLGCDYFSAYRKFARLNENVRLQFCLAHFIRDVKFLADHPNAENRAHGQRLLSHLKRLFEIIHRRDEYPTETGFRQAMARVRNQLVWDTTCESPHTSEALALEDRYYKDTEAYFRFITEPDIEPTNNLAEQALRFIAVLRRITQGTRGATGRLWSERIWTVIGTCAIQDRSTFEFLVEAVTALVTQQPAPSLLPPIESSA